MFTAMHEFGDSEGGVLDRISCKGTHSEECREVCGTNVAQCLVDRITQHLRPLKASQELGLEAPQPVL